MPQMAKRKITQTTRGIDPNAAFTPRKMTRGPREPSDQYTAAFYALCSDLKHEFEQLKKGSKIIHVHPLI